MYEVMMLKTGLRITLIIFIVIMNNYFSLSYEILGSERLHHGTLYFLLSQHQIGGGSEVDNNVNYYSTPHFLSLTHSLMELRPS
jgi:hypothetical protein